MKWNTLHLLFFILVVIFLPFWSWSQAIIGINEAVYLYFAIALPVSVLALAEVVRYFNEGAGRDKNKEKEAS